MSLAADYSHLHYHAEQMRKDALRVIDALENQLAFSRPYTYPAQAAVATLRKERAKFATPIINALED